MVVSTVYSIVAPKKIEKKDVEITEVPPKSYLIRVKMTQLCDADSKYYFGLRPKFPYSLFGFKYFFGVRDKKSFNKKYPLVPVHEAIGIVEKADEGSSLKENTRVVLIPIIPCDINGCEFCSKGNENYCKNSKFMSSNAPGFARSHLIQLESGVAKIPNEVPDEVAIFTEISTVAYGAIEAANFNRNNNIAIFGDGYLAYILSILISSLGVRKENLFIFGKHDEKLSMFNGFSTTVNISKSDIPKNLNDTINTVFECVGKGNAEKIIDTSINLIKAGGCLVLLGVSEEKILVNTRDILSKNITVKGVSRSPAKYYPIVLDKMKDKKLQELYKRIPTPKLKINSVEDIKKSFEEYMINRKKLLMEWS